MDKKHRRTEQRAGGRAVTAGRIRPLQNAAPPATQRSRPLLDDAHGLMAQNEPAPTESAPDEASRDEPGGDAAARPGDKDILPPEPSVPTATVTVQGGPADDQRHGSGHPDETNDRARARELFAQLVAMPDRTPERAEIRDQLVRMHLPLVEYLARRFRNRGEPLDDLTQVATIGLIKSVDRFDPERGVEFSTYATPTIVGEIKRHFRDKGWAIRVPRRLQELKLSLTKATSELSQTLGRSPTVSEIAAHLQMTEEEVLEGLESANAYSAVSLDAPDSGDDEAPAVADTLGVQD
ncbi:sigma-70 family RNA polymerase sigma factor, partial [Frankia sp. CiP3]